MRAALLFVFFLFFNAALVHAESPPDILAPTLEIQDAWAKPNYGPNGAAYFSIKNHGQTKRYLTGATSPLSTRVELHQHIHQDGIMRMRRVKEGLDLGPGQSLTFAPGGLHVMLFGMQQKLKPGDVLPLSLTFKDGSQQSLLVKVR